MGGSHPTTAAAAAAAVHMGRALLPIGTHTKIGGGGGGGGGRAGLHQCFCRHPLLQSRCFGTSKSLPLPRATLPELFDRNWMLSYPGAKINQISLVPETCRQQTTELSVPSFANDSFLFLVNGLKGQGRQSPSFFVVRDDLLHPLVNGNKARKLDAIIPILQEHSVTDVVTCGGAQSAHAAAVAVACSERGMRSHLLLRGEQPAIPTGYNLISTLYGNITYIIRSAYAKRKEMLSTHAHLVAGHDGSVVWLDDLFDRSLADQKPAEQLLGPNDRAYFPSVGDGKGLRKVVIISEGAGDVLGLLGVIRLVKYLSQAHLFGNKQEITIVVDAGTGTTAVGLAIGAICLGLPWKIVAVMLADSIDDYRSKEKCLISDYKRICKSEYLELALNGYGGGIVHWVERIHPRRFGRVRKGEVEMCRLIAKQTGILVDPVYTLSAWEHAVCLCQAGTGHDQSVVMLHTGGTLGIFGLAQRYKSYFHDIEDIIGYRTS